MIYSYTCKANLVACKYRQRLIVPSRVLFVGQVILLRTQTNHRVNRSLQQAPSVYN